jgi:hypothetical protein
MHNLNLLNIISNICAFAIFAVVDLQRVLRIIKRLHPNHLPVPKISLIIIKPAVKENIHRVAILLFQVKIVPKIVKVKVTPLQAWCGPEGV